MMTILDIKDRSGINEHDTPGLAFGQFQDLISELRKRPLGENVTQSINEYITDLNSSPAMGKDFEKVLKEKQRKILQLLEKELKIVPKNHYRNIWLAVGMSAFGLPIGAAIGIIARNIGLLAVGLPIGMGVGVLVGTRMDKNAAVEGRQLDIEIKH